jgi:ATP-dependent Lhr-like helicase
MPRAARAWTRTDALVELLRGRFTISGPTTAAALAATLAVTEEDVDAALLTLESEGAVLRGVFTPGVGALEWCDRRLLARIHRYTLHRLRAEIAPVSAAQFMRFLFSWQHAEPASRLSGIDGLRAVITQLDGLELPARAWEADVLPRRLDRYEASMLDMLCLTGAVGWAKISRSDRSDRSDRSSRSDRSDPLDRSDRLPSIVSATPIALFLREHADAWLSLAVRSGAADARGLCDGARAVLDHLATRGASFGHDVAAAASLDAGGFYAAIAELVAAGLVTSDGFAGLRGVVAGNGSGSAARVNRADTSGRWSTLQYDAAVERHEAVEAAAWTLLRRYGVVFRRLLAREGLDVPWRELARVYRLLEARGDIRGGRFVSGMSGEQFALPDAVERLREIRRSGDDDRLMTVSAADPLNLTGIVTPGDRIRAVAGNRIVYRNGVPAAAMEGDMLRTLGDVDPALAPDVAAAAAGRRVPVVSGYVGRI